MNASESGTEGLREACRRNFLHAHGRAASDEELSRLIRAEQAAAGYDGRSRARAKYGDPRPLPAIAALSGTTAAVAPPPPESLAAAPPEQQDVTDALAYAKAHSVASLTEAVRWFVEHRPNPISLSAAVAEFHLAKRCQGIREPTLRGYRDHVGAFAETFGSAPIASITPKNVADYLLRWSNSTTRANRWQYLATFFTWAIRRGYCGSHPVFLAMRKPLRPKSERCIFTPKETREILRQSKDTPDIGYWALALFAGLRTQEIRWLHDHRDPWSVIRKGTGVIDLRDQPPKSSPRIVPILPVLRPWLAWMRKRDVPFLPLDHWKVRRGLKLAVLTARFGSVAGSRSGEQVRFYNMARRTYISYRLALPGASYAEVSNDVGNSELILRKFYAQRASRAEAQRYFSLTPNRL
jgi:integrase